MKKRFLSVGLLIAFAAGLLVVQARSQQVQQYPAQGPGQRFVTQTDPTTGTTTYTLATAANNPRSEIDQLMKALNTADDESKKAEITKKLEEAVVKYFDEDLKVREEELKKIDERLKKLTSQLERRRKAKTEIVQLQLKVLMNEADGLGFGGSPITEQSQQYGMFGNRSGVNFYAPPTLSSDGPGTKGPELQHTPASRPAR